MPFADKVSSNICSFFFLKKMLWRFLSFFLECIPRETFRVSKNVYMQKCERLCVFMQIQSPFRAYISCIYVGRLNFLPFCWQIRPIKSSNLSPNSFSLLSIAPSSSASTFGTKPCVDPFSTWRRRQPRWGKFASQICFRKKIYFKYTHETEKFLKKFFFGGGGGCLESCFLTSPTICTKGEGFKLREQSRFI